MAIDDTQAGAQHGARRRGVTRAPMGVKKKPSAQHQPRGEFKNILAEILVSGEQAPKPIEQTMAQVVRPK